MYFKSWKLYTMLTTEDEMLLISSEEPFVQAFTSGASSGFVRTSRSRLSFGRRK